MIKPSDLGPRQRKAYDTWRSIGLTESAAMDALAEDGLIELTEDENLARRLQRIFPRTSDSAARAAARGRNPEPSADHRARVAESVKRSFDLTDHQAELAADGRDGTPRKAPSKQPLSEAELAELRPDPALIGDVIRTIERVAADYVRQGVPEQKALEESAFGLMKAMPTDALADWIVRIAALRWPGLWTSPGSSRSGQKRSSGTQTRKVGEATRQPRAVSE